VSLIRSAPHLSTRTVVHLDRVLGADAELGYPGTSDSDAEVEGPMRAVVEGRGLCGALAAVVAVLVGACLCRCRHREHKGCGEDCRNHSKVSQHHQHLPSIE